MSLSDLEQQTVAAYNQRGVEWSQAHSSGKDFWGYELSAFGSYLGPNKTVLEACVGSGRESEGIGEFASGYVGIDISSTFVQIAQEENLEMDFAQSDLYDLPFAENSFGGFVSLATLLHIPRDRLSTVLQNLHSVTIPNGIGLISMKEGIGDDQEPMLGDVDLERLFVYYQADEFEQILKQNGFEVIWYNYRPLSKRSKFMSYIVKVVK